MKKLTSQFEDLERQRHTLLQKFETFNEDQFKAQPAPGKWSASQILTHLLVSEQLSVAYMRKKIQAIQTLGNSGISSTFRLWILILSQRLPLKYKAPKVVVENTPEAKSLPEIINLWNNVRLDLKSLLHEIGDSHAKKLIYKHPYAGRLNISQAIRFFKEHIIHHWPQLNRLTK